MGFFKFNSLYFLFFIFVFPIVETSPKSITLNLINVKTLPTALEYATRSRIYPQFPNLLFVTTRNCGLSIFNLDDPENPDLIAQWTESLTLEGQDLIDGLLVLVDLSINSGVWTVDPSNVKTTGELKTLGFVKMPVGICCLHINLFRNSEGIYAVVSNNGFYWKDYDWYEPPDVKPTGIVLLNVTDPTKPSVVSVVEMELVSKPEGIIILPGAKNTFYVLVGGYGGGYAGVVDISNVSNPTTVDEWSKPYYLELNSLVRKEYPNLVYSALFGSPGGLVVFNISQLPKISEVSNILGENLSGANRVNMHPKEDFLFMPLEWNHSIGVIDVSDVENLKLAALEIVPDHGVEEFVYCLAIHPDGSHVYAFAAVQKSVFVYSIENKEY